MTRRPYIPPRLPIFLGGEGASEGGYGAFLNRIAHGVAHIHIHCEVLQPGAGSPVALIRRAVTCIRTIERRRDPFAVKAVLLDLGNEEENAEAIRIAQQNGIDYLVWQDPDHEAFLLRHFPGCQTRRPPRGATLAAIQCVWPEYYKGMPAQLIGQQIDLACVRAACVVENDLRNFLRKIGLVP